MARVAVGSAWLFLDFERGCSDLEHLLAWVRQRGNDAQLANLLAYLGACCTELHQFARAEGYLAEGLSFTADRGLDLFQRFILAWQALVDVRLGRWDRAEREAQHALQRPGLATISKITALTALGRLRARRGESGGLAVLDEAVDLATRTGSLPHLGLACAARAEAAWLAGDRAGTLAAARPAYDLALSKGHAWFTGALGHWRRLAGDGVTLPDWAAEPYRLQSAGRWQAAADAWARLGCGYEQAQALAEGDRASQREALVIFDRLGARPAAEALRQQMAAGGTPRRARAATRANPYGLTARQAEILALLGEDLSNAEIAARLHLSAKTVNHHVSAVLAKLGVPTRHAAGRLARQLSNSDK
jgi:DNA-binding CsgD family transcriptional regulator